MLTHVTIESIKHKGFSLTNWYKSNRSQLGVRKKHADKAFCTLPARIETLTDVI